MRRKMGFFLFWTGGFAGLLYSFCLDRSEALCTKDPVLGTAPQSHSCCPPQNPVSTSCIAKPREGEEKRGGECVGLDEGLHPTRAAGNLGSAALLLLLLPADAAKAIFLALILHPPLPPSPLLPSPPGYHWLTVSWGNLPSLACFLEREGTAEEKEIFDNLCFSTSPIGAAGCARCPVLPALGLTLLCQQEEVWREHRAAEWKDAVSFKQNLNQTEQTQNPEACAINEAHSWFFFFFFLLTRNVNYSAAAVFGFR